MWPMLTAFNTRTPHLETPKLNAFCIDLIPYEINIALEITGWPAYCTGRVYRLVQNQEVRTVLSLLNTNTESITVTD